MALVCSSKSKACLAFCTLTLVLGLSLLITGALGLFDYSQLLRLSLVNKASNGSLEAFDEYGVSGGGYHDKQNSSETTQLQRVRFNYSQPHLTPQRNGSRRRGDNNFNQNQAILIYFILLLHVLDMLKVSVNA